MNERNRCVSDMPVFSTCDSNPGEFRILMLFIWASVTKTTGLGLLTRNAPRPLPSETAQSDYSMIINTGSKPNMGYNFFSPHMWAA